MTAGDRAVRWIERAFYVMVVITIVWQFLKLPDSLTQFDEPSVLVFPYIAVVTAWLYAMGTRNRKPPKDSKP